MAWFLVTIRFPIVKLYDYRDRWAELEQSANIFATVVMAHLQSQLTHDEPDARLHSKMHLLRRLYERGYERQHILDLFRFLDWVLVLPEELESQFQIELDHLEAERNMPYISRLERRATERGLQQGRQEGRQEEATLVLRRLLTRRFGSLPAWVEQRLEQASPAELEQWVERVLDARTLEEVLQPLA